ncbi:uncharacterized protein PAC_13511 [Phialocephala subalpina]|uniref:Uncharacterized protein n=1 Tax=Phialocephala subalpina TaxID=576137 RepID=A0A1L7XF14_9HELO|nr:uncharacterized protein PAC_13511 [Phialocephala subalpina]
MPLDTDVDAYLISDMEKEMSNKAETNAGAESKEKSLDLGEEESSKSRLNAEKKIELEKWKQVLMGQQFDRDNSSPFPGQYNPADQSIVMPENVRYIIAAESGDYDRERLSVYLNMQFQEM